jgi:hypothetical protein
MGIIMAQYERADRFHFGFCNAFERSALETAEQIRATPTKDMAGALTADRLQWCTAGVYAALAAIFDGQVDAALECARVNGLSQGSVAGLRDMLLSVRDGER